MQPKRFSGCSRADAISSLRRLRAIFILRWLHGARRERGTRGRVERLMHFHFAGDGNGDRQVEVPDDIRMQSAPGVRHKGAGRNDGVVWEGKSARKLQVRGERGISNPPSLPSIVRASLKFHFFVVVLRIYGRINMKVIIYSANFNLSWKVEGNFLEKDYYFSRRPDNFFCFLRPVSHIYIMLNIKYNVKY